MAREHNFLLGKAEKLSEAVSIPRKVSDKNPPYTFAAARERLQPRLSSVADAASKLPQAACPGDEVVTVVTMHPRYVSKSDFPGDLFKAVGVRAVGSRSRLEYRPGAWGIDKHPETATTEEIFVAGTRSHLKAWSQGLGAWKEDRSEAEQLTHLDDVQLFDDGAKLRSTAKPDGRVLEVVLHTPRGSKVAQQFCYYAEGLQAKVHRSKMRIVGGLTFVALTAKDVDLKALAQFSFVRVVRGMPPIRPIVNSVVRSVPPKPVQFPTVDPWVPELKALVFDGGIPESCRQPLSRWVTYSEPKGIGNAHPSLEEHGLGVTGALLFGRLSAGSPLERPFCSVEHVRVLDVNTGAKDIHCYDVLDRITKKLDEEPDTFKLINLSLGPQYPIDDADVDPWTVELDTRLAHGKAIVTVAAGNDGEANAHPGDNRIQPPSDSVNVIGVGASDTESTGWSRAAYSCIGPGRCPGLVKPDGLAFGGSDSELFGLLSPALAIRDDLGTSFSSPLTLRAAAAVLAQLGADVTPLGVRALLIHHAQSSKKRADVHAGWGRFELDPRKLITCNDDEVLVIYQDKLPVKRHLRVQVPMPAKPLPAKTRCHISATLVISPEVDPEHAGSYTRSGLEAVFRPHKARFPKPKPGEPAPTTPKSKNFFTPKSLYSAPEYLLREVGHKWEPCRRASVGVNSGNLDGPFFDIYYHQRKGRTAVASPQPIPYAMVVSVRVPKVKDFYNQVVRAYPALVQLKSKLQVLVPASPGTSATT